MYTSEEKESNSANHQSEDEHSYPRFGRIGIFSNAYLTKTDHGVVAIDATLTASESRALRARVASLNKPLLAVLLTHAHPDHVAGLTELVGSSDVTIIALESVEQLMRATEEGIF